jgi:hypothetical protein
MLQCTRMPRNSLIGSSRDAGLEEGLTGIGVPQMRHIVSAATALWLAMAVGTNAQTASQPVVVVELYTSQGCSSCPPADDFFAELVQDPRVIPLALHVDYWDYIGWEDGFAKPQFTDRQKAYARAAGSRTIYTPQMIVGGLDRVEGHRPTEVQALINAHLRLDADVSLRMVREGDMLRISAEALEPLDGPVRVQLVRYRPAETVEIQRGENAGRTVTYHNIVTAWQPLGEWTGDSPLSVEAAVPGPDAAVVILQAPGPSAILAAARVD